MVAVHTKAIRHCSRLQYIEIGNSAVLLATHLHVAMFFSVRDRKVMFCFANG
jgi:hypothetical protein